MNKYLCQIALTGFILLFNLPLNAQKGGKTELKATISSISSGDMSKEILLETGLIECSNTSYEIVYFNFSILRENGDLIAYYGRGNTLTESMKAEIKSLKPGTKVVFDEIGAKSGVNKTIKLPAIVLILK